MDCYWVQQAPEVAQGEEAETWVTQPTTPTECKQNQTKQER